MFTHCLLLQRGRKEKELGSLRRDREHEGNGKQHCAFFLVCVCEPSKEIKIIMNNVEWHLIDGIKNVY